MQYFAHFLNDLLKNVFLYMIAAILDDILNILISPRAAMRRQADS